MSDFEDALANSVPSSITELSFDFSEDGVLDGRIAALTGLRELQLRRVPPDLVLPEELLALPALRCLGLAGVDQRLVVPGLVRRLPLERLEVTHLRAADLPPMPGLRELEITIKNLPEDIAVLAERFSR